MVNTHPIEPSPIPAEAQSERVRALVSEAAELCRRGEVPRALVVASDAREVAAGSGRAGLNAQSLASVAQCRFCLGDLVPALDLFRQAALHYQAANDEGGLAAARGSIGLCQHRMGEHEAAIESLLEAMDSMHALRLTALQAMLHSGLASAHIALNQRAEAEKHLAAGIAIADAEDNRDALMDLFLNESLLHRRHGEAIAGQRLDDARREWRLALDLAERALALARALAHRRNEAQCLVQSGATMSLLGRTGAARDALTMALELAREIEERALQAEALLALGRLHAASGDVRNAASHLQEAADVAERSSSRDVLAEAYAELAALSEAQGDAVAALDHFKRFHAIREAQFETTRTHAARAFNLWRDFQRATRQASELRERAATLAEDKQILERRADELAEVSEQDPLTGLLNRRALDTRISAVVSASESEGLPMTVALIDVDHFKEINDRFSHGVGDAVLKRIADVVRDHCRVGDLPVRYGGDEFLVVLLGVGQADAEPVLQRLKRAVDGCQWQREPEGLTVTLSVGAATRAAGRSITDTIAAADRALYAAKAAGRNRIVCVGSTSGPEDPATGQGSASAVP